MPIDVFKKAVARKGYDMFGAGVHHSWTGVVGRPYLTPEEEAMILKDSQLRD